MYLIYRCFYYNLVWKWCSLGHARNRLKKLRLRVSIGLAGHSQWMAEQDWGLCPAWRVYTGYVVLPPVRAHTLQNRTQWHKPHICSEASLYLGIGRTPKQVGKGTRKVQPQMCGSVKHETVKHCSVIGHGSGVAVLLGCSRLSPQTLPWYQGLSTSRCQVYLLK